MGEGVGRESAERGRRGPRRLRARRARGWAASGRRLRAPHRGRWRERAAAEMWGGVARCRLTRFSRPDPLLPRHPALRMDARLHAAAANDDVDARRTQNTPAAARAAPPNPLSPLVTHKGRPSSL